MNNEYSQSVITALRACADFCERICIDADAPERHREESAVVLRQIETVLLFRKD